MMIKLYSKTICPKCMVAKSFFKNNEINYEEINTDTDLKAKQKLLDEGFLSVPIVEHEEKFYINMTEFQELADKLK